jgi:anti-sigma-K factor RskA
MVDKIAADAVVGVVSVEEAREALQRLINSHFNNSGEHARISIPVRL